MALLKCTKLVRDFAGIKVDAMSTAIYDQSALGSWYVHLFTVDRRRTLIFMNETTLMSFISYGIKKSHCSNLDIVFRRGLEQLLRMENVRENKIQEVVATYAELSFARTDSRSVLGTLNDLVGAYRHSILYDGGFLYCNIGDVIRDVNRTPQRNLSWQTSIVVMHERLGDARRGN